jgi:predicted XRE-type DNA-binding protein
MIETDDTTIHRGSGNLFADLGYADPDTHLLKAELVNRMLGVIRDRKLTQTQVAQLTGFSQPDVSRVLKGQFRDVSVERLMRVLTRLGCEIDIVVKPTGSETGPGIHFGPSPAPV